MDNYTGSLVEPSSPQVKNIQPRKINKLLIVALLELIIIIGLALALIITNLPNNTSNISLEDFGEIVENEIDEYEVRDLRLNESEKSTFMYIYATASNASLKKNGLTASICQNLANIYNRYFSESVASSVLCPNNRLTVSAEVVESEEYPYLDLIKLGIVLGSQSYNYYMYTDFSAIDNLDVSELDSNIKTTIISYE